MFHAAKGSHVIALLFVTLAVISLSLYLRGGNQAQDDLFLGIGFGLAAIGEIYRPAGLFSRSRRQVPVTHQLLLYCLFTLAAIVVALVGSFLQWP